MLSKTDLDIQTHITKGQFRMALALIKGPELAKFHLPSPLHHLLGSVEKQRDKRHKLLNEPLSVSKQFDTRERLNTQINCYLAAITHFSDYPEMEEMLKSYQVNAKYAIKSMMTRLYEAGEYNTLIKKHTYYQQFFVDDYAFHHRLLMQKADAQLARGANTELLATYAEALVLCDKGEWDYCDSQCETWLARAESFTRSGHLAEAKEDLGAVINSFTEDDEEIELLISAHRQRAKIHMQEKDWKSAVNDWDQVDTLTEVTPMDDEDDIENQENQENNEAKSQLRKSLIKLREGYNPIHDWKEMLETTKRLLAFEPDNSYLLYDAIILSRTCCEHLQKPSSIASLDEKVQAATQCMEFAKSLFKQGETLRQQNHPKYRTFTLSAKKIFDICQEEVKVMAAVIEKEKENDIPVSPITHWLSPRARKRQQDEDEDEDEDEDKNSEEEHVPFSPSKRLNTGSGK
ncbi:MAG: hypothetical protein DHS20C10_11970 [marine bacterium B5-7]|nr:MAG: hypothetical protein DHS20C10_11970 [marine bacterium B5-7]